MKNRRCHLPKALGVVLFLIFISTIQAFSQQNSVGIFEGQTDVGKPAQSGSAIFDAENQRYTLSGSGSNMWAERDEFHFVWKRLRGNFILQTQAQFVGKGVEAHRKIGWMVRSTLEPNSAHVNATVHGDGLTSLQYRKTAGGITEEIKSPVKGADIIQLEKRGNNYVMSVARFGDTFTDSQISDMPLGDEVYVGLYVCSHNQAVTEKAVYQNTRIIIPAAENFVPYRDYIGSNLEIMDMATGSRKIIYTSPDSLQAPNWTKDGKTLIYNSKGKLFGFDLATKIPRVIDTDFATGNNNDHVLSFDGKWLGISHHSRDDGNKSIIYVVPVGGGKPRRVTAKGHSYLHGWSPDGKFLIYTAERNGEFDIYKIPSAGGEEVNLTNSKGLDDGSEYAPDGKYIYFNSARSGTMQLWRMKADGSNPEQLTNDEFNNWFPHLSPNGKWVVFLSFLKEVSPNDHPFYKQVYLRLMPVQGGQAKVIAYVYGGQGTINVPSWSPDSKKIAFISNTQMK
ncbi:MAG: biopolymer transporter TolR [Acidobacteriota bacterium]